jgi:hypothetical protein
MRLLKSVISLITEQATRENIIDAIKNRKVIIIYYDGDEPGGTGLREIEPVCLGYSKANNLVLRAWDYEGASHTGYLGSQPLPGWRLFRIDKIMSFKPTGDFFDSPRPDYNFDGDDSMTNIIINAIFDGVTSLKDIIENNLDNIINDVISKYMSELVKPYQNNRESLQKFLTDLKLESAAEAYRRIYSEIRRYLGRNLTQKDINKLRPIVSNKIAEIQLAIKNNYLK